MVRLPGNILSRMLKRTGSFEIEVGKEYDLSYLFEYYGEFVMVYNGDIVACPCDVDKDRVVIDKIEEVQFDNGEVVNVVWVR